jgi:hypothetical protein
MIKVLYRPPELGIVDKAGYVQVVVETHFGYEADVEYAIEQRNMWIEHDHYIPAPVFIYATANYFFIWVNAELTLDVTPTLILETKKVLRDVTVPQGIMLEVKPNSPILLQYLMYTWLYALIDEPEHLDSEIYDALKTLGVLDAVQSGDVVSRSEP